MPSHRRKICVMRDKRRIISALIIIVYILAGCQEESHTTIGKEDYGIKNQQVLSKVVDGLHEPTGLKAGIGLTEVLRHCVSCHSAKLITQNRATKEGWKTMIHWMYETQNLPKLGESEQIIIAYLAEHYPPGSSGRRKGLTEIDWYDLPE